MFTLFLFTGLFFSGAYLLSAQESDPEPFLGMWALTLDYADNNAGWLEVTGGALSSDDFSPGPVYLQGDHGKVRYRNIVLTPIED